MPDPGWVAVGGTIAINAGLAFYVAGTVKEQVRSLMDWRDREAKPTLEKHGETLARMSAVCPLAPHGRSLREYRDS